MADVNPGTQYANWQQYGGSDSAFGEVGSNLKKWLAAGAAQKSGLVDFLDSLGAPVPKGLQPVAPPTLGTNASAPPPAAPAAAVTPVAPVAPGVPPMQIPGVGEIKSITDKLKEVPNYLDAIWGKIGG